MVMKLNSFDYRGTKKGRVLDAPDRDGPSARPAKTFSCLLKNSAHAEFFGLSALHGLGALPFFKHVRVRKMPVDPSTA
jgi:hypothetical protein